MDNFDKLLIWIDGRESECVEKVRKLIKDDAPKNKFSVVTGHLDMIEEVKSQIEVIRREES